MGSAGGDQAFPHLLHGHTFDVQAKIWRTTAPLRNNSILCHTVVAVAILPRVGLGRPWRAFTPIRHAFLDMSSSTCANQAFEPGAVAASKFRGASNR